MKDYLLQPFQDNARLEGIKAFNEGKNFAQCPRTGFKEEDIEWRWQWQKGWLRAQLDKQDKDHPPSYKV